MNIIIFDSEYLSTNKKKYNKDLIKYQNLLFPEIIQIGVYKYKNFFSKKKVEKKNFYFKIKQKLPKRIENLTGITKDILKNKGKFFNKSIRDFFKLIDNESIVFANGKDFEIIKLNMKYNKVIKIKKSIKFVNLREILGNIDTEKRYLKLKYKKIKLHNALNDCLVLKLSIDNFIKSNGKGEFLKKIKKKEIIIKI
tara:strand:- start:25 stop:612 length:588 start_codon:yes stop_codon:yes gene_type:complete